MVIAKHRAYYLQHRTFLGIDRLTTFQIELCKKVNDSYITLCRLNKETLNLECIDNRVIESIETIEDVESLKLLTKILYNIYETEEYSLE